MARTARGLTDTKIRTFKPKKAEEVLFDNVVTGLMLRFRQNGSRDWLLRYTISAKQKKINIGGYPLFGLIDAREKAREFKRLVENGIDPIAERERIKAEKAEQEALSKSLPQNITELFTLWKVRELKTRKDAGDETERKFKKDVFPKIGSLPLESIKRSHVLDILDTAKQRGAPRIAGIILSELRQLYAFALDRELVPSDPTAGLKKSKLGGNANERDRVLSDTEIKQLVKAMPNSLSEDGQNAVWIMFLMSSYRTAAEQLGKIFAQWQGYATLADSYVNLESSPRRLPVLGTPVTEFFLRIPINLPDIDQASLAINLEKDFQAAVTAARVHLLQGEQV